VKEHAQIVWQKFIHQPQTGRCLVFLLVAGQLCQKITKTYKDSIDRLTSILELDVSYGPGYFSSFKFEKEGRV
jgi:hypothetical protein